MAGQTAEQMTADQSACEAQAAAQTGYYPSQPAPATPASQPARGQRLAGAARGAALGGIREQTSDAEDREIEDATGAGAKVGAVVGGSRQRQARREARREATQAQQTQAQMADAYNLASTACLTAKGYEVQ